MDAPEQILLSLSAHPLHSLGNFDPEKTEGAFDLSQRESAKPEPGRPQSFIAFRQNVVLGVKTAEILRQPEDVVADEIRRALGLCSQQCFRHGEKLQSE